MLAVMALVGLSLAGFIAGFLIGWNETRDEPGDLTVLLAIIVLVGGVWFVSFLIGSMSAFFDHSDINRSVWKVRDTTVSPPPVEGASKPVRKVAPDLPYSWMERMAMAADPTQTQETMSSSTDSTSKR